MTSIHLYARHECFAELLKVCWGPGPRFHVSLSQTWHVYMSWANRDRNTCGLQHLDLLPCTEYLVSIPWGYSSSNHHLVVTYPILLLSMKLVSTCHCEINDLYVCTLCSATNFQATSYKYTCVNLPTTLRRDVRDRDTLVRSFGRRHEHAFRSSIKHSFTRVNGIQHVCFFFFIVDHMLKLTYFLIIRFFS